MQGLIQLARRIEEKTGYIRLGVMSGDAWASGKSIQQTRNPHVRMVRGRVQSVLAALDVHYDWSCEMWFTRLGPGGSIGSHSHYLNHWGGVLHLTEGKDLILELEGEEHRVLAVPGSLILFPGDTFHRVDAEDSMRYSLAMNFDRTGG